MRQRQTSPLPPPKLRISALRQYGIRPREVPESPARVLETGSDGNRQVPTETGTSPYRKPAQRCAGNRHTEP